jgi:hypothetical protein
MKSKIGRPTKLTPAVIDRIAECFFNGFTDQETAILCHISRATILRARSGGFCDKIKKAELVKKQQALQQIRAGRRAWQCLAWFLERRYPTQFSRPEIQLALNQAVNAGPTNIVVLGPERAKVLASRHEQIRAKSLELLDKKSASGNGNGNDSESG